MALSSASRASSTQHLNIKFMARNVTPYKLHFHKNWRRGKAPPTASYQVCTQDPNLCFVKTLDEYISCTEDWRSGEECSQLLISFVKPHKPVVSFTISGCLKKCFEETGAYLGT